MSIKKSKQNEHERRIKQLERAVMFIVRDLQRLFPPMAEDATLTADDRLTKPAEAAPVE